MTFKPRRRRKSDNNNGVKACHSSAGQPTIRVRLRVGAGEALNNASSLRMARPAAKCSCCTLARFSYHKIPISDIPFCKTCVQTASTGKMENAWFRVCSADDSLKLKQASIHCARSESRVVSDAY